jgi:hypothetical protein
MSRVTLRGSNIARDNKVEAIKAVRRAADLGLKDAKDTIEAMMDGHSVTVDVNISDSDVRDALDTLRAVGGEIHTTGEELITRIRDVAIDALRASEDALAVELLDALINHKSRVGVRQ